MLVSVEEVTLKLEGGSKGGSGTIGVPVIALLHGLTIFPALVLTLTLRDPEPVVLIVMGNSVCPLLCALPQFMLYSMSVIFFIVESLFVLVLYFVSFNSCSHGTSNLF